MNLILVLGNQLFNPKIYQHKNVDPKGAIFFMREDAELASYYKFHKHKIIYFFAAMRAYRDELIFAGYQVHYEEFKRPESGDCVGQYEMSLRQFIKKKKISEVSLFEVEDKFFEKRILSLFADEKVSVSVWPSLMFLTSREQFKNYLGKTRRPFMKTFYEAQRKRLKILIEDDKPVGGSWSFDSENRLALPKGHVTPSLPSFKIDKTLKSVCSLVDKEFADHPGEGSDFWIPVDRQGAKEWLHAFLKDRINDFGPYEDAIAPHSEFVYHSVLTPFLNCGLLTPHEVIKETLAHAKNHEVPLASLEGFIRQIIGWREFIRGVYQSYSEKQESENFWKAKNKLSPVWYEGKTGVPPLDETIRRVVKRGYAHHIERLMIVGSLMVLLEVDPQEAHRWFMEMFIDSSDWVMGPNVYGMALFSDGGIFATKPYICGSNYLRKMGGYPKAEWCDGVDGLYWRFIQKHQAFFSKNPRLSMITKSCQKISEDRWQVLNKAAAELKNRLVYTP